MAFLVACVDQCGMYSLSSQLEGHTADVRALSHTSDGQIVSTSRDVTCRLWQRSDRSPRDYKTNKTLQGHSRYIIAVCALPKDFAEVIGTFARTDLIATGSNDHLINLYALDTDETLLNPIAAFKGHTNAVCCLNYHRGALLSSSWDGTCRVWKGVNSFVELKGHTSTVWCVVGVPDTEYLLSASGDRSLRLWDMQVRLFLLFFINYNIYLVIIYSLQYWSKGPLFMSVALLGSSSAEVRRTPGRGQEYPTNRPELIPLCQ